MEDTENKDVYNQKLKELQNYKFFLDHFINVQTNKTTEEDKTKLEKMITIKELLESKRQGNLKGLKSIEEFLIKLKINYEKRNKPSTSIMQKEISAIINLVDDSDDDNDDVQFVSYEKPSKIKSNQNLKIENESVLNSTEKKEDDECDVTHRCSKIELESVKNELNETVFDHNYSVHHSQVEQNNELNTQTNIEENSKSTTVINETDSGDTKENETSLNTSPCFENKNEGNSVNECKKEENRQQNNTENLDKSNNNDKVHSSLSDLNKDLTSLRSISHHKTENNCELLSENICSSRIIPKTPETPLSTETLTEIEEAKIDNKNDDKENDISTKQSISQSNIKVSKKLTVDNKLSHSTEKSSDSKENKLRNITLDQNQLIKKSAQSEDNNNSSEENNKYKKIFELIDNSLSDVSEEDNLNYNSSEDFEEKEPIKVEISPKEQLEKNKKHKKKKKNKKNKTKEKIREDSKKEHIEENSKPFSTKYDKSSLLKTSESLEKNSTEYKNTDKAVLEWSKIAASYDSRSCGSSSDMLVKTATKELQKSSLDEHIDSRNSVLYDDFELEPSTEDYEFLGLQKPNKIEISPVANRLSETDSIQRKEQRNELSKLCDDFLDDSNDFLLMKTVDSELTTNKHENDINQNDKTNKSCLFHRRQKKSEKEQQLFDVIEDSNTEEFLRKLDRAIESDEDKLSTNKIDENKINKIDSTNEVISNSVYNFENCNKHSENEKISESPKQLGLIVIDESSDEDEANKSERNIKDTKKNLENNTYSRETSPLAVKFISRENTPPRIISPDHLKEIINSTESQSQSKHQLEKNQVNNFENQNFQNDIVQTNEKNLESATSAPDELSTCSQRNHNSFLKFLDTTKENEMSLPELLQIRREIEKEINIPFSTSQINKILGFSKLETEEKTEMIEVVDKQTDKSNLLQTSDVITDSDIDSDRNAIENKTVESEINHKKIEIDNEFLNKCYEAMSLIMQKTQMNAIQSQTFNTNYFTPPTPPSPSVTLTYPVQTTFIPQQSNIYPINMPNYPRYPMINRNDPRLRNRLKQLFQKTETFSIQQENQQHRVPLPPPGPPLSLDQLPEPPAMSETYKECQSRVSKASTSEFARNYEQVKQAALARKAAKEEERKRNEYTEMASKIPNTESVMDKMYRTGDYFLESSTPLGFKIPKKKKDDESKTQTDNEVKLGHISETVRGDKIESSIVKSKPVKNRRRSSVAPKEVSDEQNKMEHFDEEIDKNQLNGVKSKPVKNRRRSSVAPKEVSDEQNKMEHFDKEIDKNQLNGVKSKPVKNRRRSSVAPKEVSDEHNKTGHFDEEIDKNQLNGIKSKPVRNRRRSSVAPKEISDEQNKMEHFDEEIDKIVRSNSAVDSEEENINEAIRKRGYNINNKKRNFNDDNDDNYENDDADYSNDIKEALEKLKNTLSEEKYLKIESIIKQNSEADLQRLFSFQKPSVSTKNNFDVSKECESSKKSKNKTNGTKTGSRRVYEVDRLKEDIANSFMAKDIFEITPRRRCSEVAERKMKNIMDSISNDSKTIIETENNSSSENEEQNSRKVNNRKRRKSMSVPREKSNNFPQDDDGEDTDDYTEHVAKKRKSNSITPNKLISGDVPKILLRKLKPEDIMMYTNKNNQLHNKNQKETVTNSDPLLQVLKEVPDDSQSRQRKIIVKEKNSRIKNKNPEYHINSKYMQFCVLCCTQDISENIIVSHYVNEHPNDEVFISRLQKTDIDKLKMNQNITSLTRDTSSMKYSTECIFCKKIIMADLFVKFNVHYSTHTGEYQYKCSECDIRKWNRKDIKNHCKNECEKDARIETYYSFDKNANIIYIYVCDKCSYVQLHKANVEKHLKTEHGLDRIEESDILQLKLIERETELIDNTMRHIEENRGVEISFEANPDNIQSQQIENTSLLNEEPFNESIVKVENEIIEDITPKVNSNYGNNIMTVIYEPNPVSSDFSERKQIMQNSLDVLQNSIEESEEIDIKPTEIQNENNFLMTENLDLNSTNLIEKTELKVCCNTESQGNEVLNESSGNTLETNVIDSNTSHQESLQPYSLVNNLETENNSKNVSELQLSNDVPTVAGDIIQDKQNVSVQNSDEVICLDDDDDNALDNEKDDIRISTGEQSIISNQMSSQFLNVSKKNTEVVDVDTNILDVTEIVRKSSLITSLKENPYVVKICNICFETRMEGIYFYCLINECSFMNTYDINIFKSHIESKHSTKMWNGICTACQKNVINEKHLPIHYEINHMLQSHINIIHRAPPFKRPLIISNESLESIIIIQLLKPWIKKTISKKTRSQCENMKQINALYAQYKCMGISCSFTTNEKNDMINHLEKHRIQNRDETNAYLECCYCDLCFTDSISLIDHINEIHGTSIFQCSNCFYRSVTAFNVVTHMYLFHQNDKDKYILECNGKIKYLQSEKKEILQSRSKNVISLQCKACPRKFYVKEYLYNHMKTQHNIMDESQLPDIGVFACIYCKFDCKNLQDIREHLANEHPTKLLYVCGRVPNKSFYLHNMDHETTIESTCIVFVGELVGNHLLKRLNHNKNSSANSQYLNNIDNSLPSTSTQTISEENSTLQEFDDILVDINDFMKYANGSYSEKTSTNKNHNKLKKLIDIVTQNNAGLSGRSLYLCAKHDCKESFKTLEEWQIHMRASHPKSLKNAKYACPHCPTKAPWLNVRDLSKHFDEHKESKFLCYFCGDLLPTSELAKKHMSMKHSFINVTIKTLNINVIDKKTNITENFECHVVLSTNIKCNQSQLMRHMIIVLQMKLGIHEDDIETYNNNNNNNNNNNDNVNTNNNNALLSTTTSSQTKVNSVESFEKNLPIFIPSSQRYVCNYESCTLKYRDRHDLENHIRQIHGLQNMYKCPHCNDEFSTNISNFYKIRNHWQLHSNSLYQCGDCLFYYCTSHELNRHIDKMHANRDITAIQFVRTVLTVKKLIQVSFAVKDINSIATINVYKCFLCLLNFNNIESMIGHMSTVHNSIVRYSCVYCSIPSEANKNAILDHLTQTHSKNNFRMYIGFYEKSALGTLQDFTCVTRVSTNKENDKDCDDDVIIIDDDCLDNNDTLATDSSNKRLLQNENTDKNENIRKKVKLNQTNAMQPKIQISEQELFKCEKCDFQTTTKELMTDHIKCHIKETGETELKTPSSLSSSTSHIQSIKPALKCDEADCCFMCDDDSNLNYHKLMNHKVSNKSNENSAQIKLPNIIVQIHHSEGNKQEQQCRTGLIRVKPIEKLLANPQNPVTSTSAIVINQHELLTTQNGPGPSNTVSLPTPLPAPSTISSTPEETFSGIIFKCSYCDLKYEVIGDLVEHWEKYHKIDYPFEYRIDRVLHCLYCNKISTFDELKSHHTHFHPQEIFVTRYLLKCTECLFECSSTNNLVNFLTHFRNAHPDMLLKKSISIDFIDENVLKTLLQIEYKAQSFQCEYCELVFRRQEMCKEHITTFHPNQPIKYLSFIENRLFYGCKSCKCLYLSEKEAIVHIRRYHVIPYKCEKCTNTFRSLSDLYVHNSNIHNYTINYENYKQTIICNFSIYREMIILFPNGLVLTKYELKNTSYGDVEEFKKLIVAVENEIKDI